MKRFISLLLSAIILMSCGITCFAAGSTEEASASERKTDFFDEIASFFKRLWNKILNILGFGFKFTGDDYSIPEIDLSTLPEELRGTEYEYLYDLYVIDDSRDYIAHPDSVLLKDGSILTVYPAGHGRGAVLNKISTDGGITWSGTIENTPESWKNSQETPTIYRLEFSDGREDKLILISANPKWVETETTGGFECSISDDEGRTWTEFQRFYSLKDENSVIPIVAMSSLTRFKENGEFVDKWMGLFHDSSFYNYKTILTFDENGNMQWSVPEKYFAAYREIEEKSSMCEVEVIRSDMGKGDELCLITRSNSKNINSLISFSQDEGKTWSEPREVPAALNGERHKAEYTPDGRLVISFRSIERGKKAKDNIDKINDRGKGWISEGLVAWVGTYEDLKNGTEGQYRLKLAHIYVEGQKKPGYYAGSDTGYCGNVVLPDGTVMICSYGKFSPDKWDSSGERLRTSICAKRIRLSDLDKLLNII